MKKNKLIYCVVVGVFLVSNCSIQEPKPTTYKLELGWNTMSIHQTLEQTIEGTTEYNLYRKLEDEQNFIALGPIIKTDEETKMTYFFTLLERHKNDKPKCLRWGIKSLDSKQKRQEISLDGKLEKQEEIDMKDFIKDIKGLTFILKIDDRDQISTQIEKGQETKATMQFITALSSALKIALEAPWLLRNEYVEGEYHRLDEEAVKSYLGKIYSSIMQLPSDIYEVINVKLESVESDLLYGLKKVVNENGKKIGYLELKGEVKIKSNITEKGETAPLIKQSETMLKYNNAIYKIDLDTMKIKEMAEEHETTTRTYEEREETGQKYIYMHETKSKVKTTTKIQYD